MTPSTSNQPCWDTASQSTPAAASALKRHALSEHLVDCGARRSRLDDLQGGADRVRQALTARVVTTVLVLSLLLGASWLLV